MTDSHKMVRLTDPVTSKEAAYTLNATELETIVYNAIASCGKSGAIGEEVENLLPHLKQNSITPRFIRLKEKGLIVQDGTKRKSSSNRNQMVSWCAKIYHSD